ncbi:MAG: triose-phosphate isomerase [Clostridiales Family XIII bacterium]|jgi:triosephosphate isomerase|nr:triose-phosphate isomerase [Clostridiales Family XIII bacterium]
MRKKFIAGNWKMHKTTAEALTFAASFKALYGSASGVEAGICAPFTQLAALKEAFAGTGIKLGAQNVHFEEKGAYTGEISVAMLREIGVDYTIVGHSERREYFGETDETVNRKLHKLYEHGILPILCVGENLAQRDAGTAKAVVEAQLAADLRGLGAASVKLLVIAYEPIWAIGTGRTATPEEAQEMCAFIRETAASLYDADTADSLRIQYGGSVKPGNAAEILNKADVDGALVGGASLVPEELIGIVNGCRPLP